uniref:Uncharacterized protein n=1 Tax=Candidatus Kentrum sp. TC TaxID=2126339 RepID=A0A450ZZ07_9GAMM|nr:MAG: hypothetical protein BECKTC1821F_GA0114240_102835 [Candidatus Kentron sp. TC]
MEGNTYVYDLPPECGRIESRISRCVENAIRAQTIEIAICDAEQAERDETAYLLDNPANRAHLLEAAKNVANKRNLVNVDLDDLIGEHRL